MIMGSLVLSAIVTGFSRVYLSCQENGGMVSTSLSFLLLLLKVVLSFATLFVRFEIGLLYTDMSKKLFTAELAENGIARATLLWIRQVQVSTKVTAHVY